MASTAKINNKTRFADQGLTIGEVETIWEVSFHDSTIRRDGRIADALVRITRRLRAFLHGARQPSGAANFEPPSRVAETRRAGHESGR